MFQLDEKTLRKSYVLQLFPESASMSAAAMTRLRKTDYYRGRISTEPISLDEIAYMSIPQIWELTHVDRSTIHRWKCRPERIPYATAQLLRYRLSGVIPQGFGDWSGSCFAKDGRLYPDGSPTGYSAAEMRGFYLTIAQASETPALREHVLRLSDELRFHKNQTKDDSRMGFMRGLVEILQE